MKKLFYTLIILCYCYFTTNAQIPNWQWAQAVNGAVSAGYGVTTDSNGNVFVTGVFLNSITIGTTTLTASIGGNDVYIVKYDPNGNVLWAKSGGGINIDYSRRVLADVAGNVYLIGGFPSPTISFGTSTLNNSGGQDIFIVKYDTNGNVIWAKKAGGAGDDVVNDAAIDISGNLYLTGYFSNSCSFGTTTLTSAGNSDVFIAKYNSSGNVISATSYGGSDDDVGSSIALDNNGNIFISGEFSSTTITFGSSILNNPTTQGYSELFIVKMDNNCNTIWAHDSNGSGMNYGISSDIYGNAYVMGWFSYSVGFGTDTLYSVGFLDIFFVKYDTNGNVVWAQSEGGTGYDACYSVKTDSVGNVYLTGFFSNTVNFGSNTVTSNGDRDFYLVKYDSSGNDLWVKTGGGNNTDMGYCIAIDGSGNILVTGGYGGPTITFGTTTLNNGGLFVAKIGSGNTSITEQPYENRLNIFPNPSSTTVSINFTSTTTSNANILLHDIYGREVIAQKINVVAGANTFTIDVSKFAAGVYTVQLANGAATYFGKVVVE